MCVCYYCCFFFGRPRHRRRRYFRGGMGKGKYPMLTCFYLFFSKRFIDISMCASSSCCFARLVAGNLLEDSVVKGKGFRIVSS